MLFAHTAAVNRQMGRQDWHLWMPRADGTTASTAPRIDQGAMPPDSGGAGPGLGPEPVIPGCARSFRITAGSCSVATRRGRPPRCAHARCIKAAQCQAHKPFAAFVPPMCPSSLRSAPAPRPGTRAPRDCTRPRAGVSGRAQSTRCDSGSWASRRPSLADCIRGPTAPRAGRPPPRGLVLSMLGTPSPIPIFPGDSRIQSHAIPM